MNSINIQNKSFFISFDTKYFILLPPDGDFKIKNTKQLNNKKGNMCLFSGRECNHLAL